MDENGANVVSELTERIQAQLVEGTYICPIDHAPINRFQPLWSCSRCYQVAHLKCIREWIREVTRARAKVSINRPSARHRRFQWDCPCCRAPYDDDELPLDVCWCGRFQNPPLPPRGGLTHSCGFQCGRKAPHPTSPQAQTACSHPCPLVCHPGECPKCIVVLEVSCRCGKRSMALRCGEAAPRWNCGLQCDKLRNCSRHRCDKVCHDGQCSPCRVTEFPQCVCGRTIKAVPCGWEGTIRCDQECGKLLRCGVHKCKEVCHPPAAVDGESFIAPSSGELAAAQAAPKLQAAEKLGSCGLPCPREPELARRCPCGKTALSDAQIASRKCCIDPIQTCDSDCGKQLHCDHRCKMQCHDSDCLPCTEAITLECPCKGTTKTGRCCELEPERQQKEVISCGRTCNVLKSCHRHRCKRICCPDRPFGSSRAEKHLCMLTCGRPLACGTHLCDATCHTGPCPPCQVIRRPPIVCNCGATVYNSILPCGAEPPECPVVCHKLLPCGHSCSTRCHYGDCPPCHFLVERTCAGGHSVRPYVHCWIDSSRIFCRASCGKELACGHTCSKRCHAAPCAQCEAPCGKGRTFCTHGCQARCHVGEACPDVPCPVNVERSCSCGRRVESIRCGAFSGQEETSTASNNLECDSSCAAERRRLQLEAAFGDHTTTTKDERASVRPPSTAIYDDELVLWAASQSSLVEALETQANRAFELPSSGVVHTFTMRSTDLLWADYYLQIHWGLETERIRDHADERFHIAMHRPVWSEECRRGAPSPRLSFVASSDLGLGIAKSPQPITDGFALHGVAKYARTTPVVVCGIVGSACSLREVARRLSHIRNPWKARWLPSARRLPGTSAPFQPPEVPSNRGVRSETLLIATLEAETAQVSANYRLSGDHHNYQKIVEIAEGSPLVFGRDVKLHVPKTTVITALSEPPTPPRLTSSGDSEKWTTVERRRR